MHRPAFEDADSMRAHVSVKINSKMRKEILREKRQTRSTARKGTFDTQRWTRGLRLSLKSRRR